MLSASDNELLTRVGPGTPMGQFMRQYWVPACMSSELQNDAAPLRVMLLGEKLIAFRDSEGRVGVLDHRCPHRCASLFFGRNEEGGVRCVYHGWKFDVEGNCLEMPNVPAKQDFSPKVKARAFKTLERAGLVWVYMGDAAEPPPFPLAEIAAVPSEHIGLYALQAECNWLQGLEGNIDTSHFGFLHMGKASPDEIDLSNMHSHALLNRAPEYHVKETPWGTMYCAYRSAGNEQTYYRVAPYLFPFWTLFPDGTFGDNIVTDIWVPMDDTHTMVYNVYYNLRSALLRTQKTGEAIGGLESVSNYSPEYMPNSDDWFGRWRPKDNIHNDYNIDRDAQRRDSFTGIMSVPIQDLAITESMGAIVDRSMEHLAASDRMIVMTRRRLLNAVKAFMADGTLPPGVRDPDVYRYARSGSFIAPESDDWIGLYNQQIREAENPTGLLLEYTEKASAR